MKKLLVITLILAMPFLASAQVADDQAQDTNGNTTVQIGGGNPKEDAGPDNLIEAGVQASGAVNDARRVGGFVPCDGGADDPCTTDSFFQLMQNVINFSVGAAILIGILVFLWNGIRFVLGGEGSASARSQFKKRMTQTLIGIFFVAAAWTIVSFLTSRFISTEFSGGEDINFLNDNDGI